MDTEATSGITPRLCGWRAIPRRRRLQPLGEACRHRAVLAGHEMLPGWSTVSGRTMIYSMSKPVHFTVTQGAPTVIRVKRENGTEWELHLGVVIFQVLDLDRMQNDKPAFEVRTHLAVDTVAIDVG